jgi:hypothetical protein
MSIIDYRTKRLSKTEALKKVKIILKQHPQNVRFSGHAIKELDADSLTIQDAKNVLLSADCRITEEPEFHKGSWRYRVKTEMIVIVVAFNAEYSLVVVTGWRIVR